MKLEDLQAYVTLRGAMLTNDDKKRVIIESDNSLEGKLTVTKVQDSIRMLGTSFFQELTGQGKKSLTTIQSTGHWMFLKIPQMQMNMPT